MPGEFRARSAVSSWASSTRSIGAPSAADILPLTGNLCGEKFDLPTSTPRLWCSITLTVRSDRGSACRQSLMKFHCTKSSIVRGSFENLPRQIAGGNLEELEPAGKFARLRWPLREACPGSGVAISSRVVE